jgi:hypothetical protein
VRKTSRLRRSPIWEVGSARNFGKSSRMRWERYPSRRESCRRESCRRESCRRDSWRRRFGPSEVLPSSTLQAPCFRSRLGARSASEPKIFASSASPSRSRSFLCSVADLRGGNGGNGPIGLRACAQSGENRFLVEAVIICSGCVKKNKRVSGWPNRRVLTPPITKIRVT